ncbi:hypothetical protein Tco_1462885, partial [Tanacetum coccineum]
YVADSDPEEDSEEDHADYPADGRDDDDEPSDDDDDDTGDEDEDPFEDKEEEHLAPADSSAVPITDPVPSVEDTEALETDEAAPTVVPLPSEEEVERLLALPIPPPSPLTPLSSLLPQIPSPPLPPPPSSLHLPPSDTPEAELPPSNRLCLTAPAPRYEVGESSTIAPRPTGGHGVDYGFIDTMDTEVRRQRAEEVDYGVRDVWVDPTEAVEEVAPTTLEGVNDRLTELAAMQEQDTQDIYAEALVSREAWAHSIRLSTAVYYELQAYRTHTQMQDYRIASQESLMMTLIAQVSSLHGQLSAALGQIQALQARDQTHADDHEGAVIYDVLYYVMSISILLCVVILVITIFPQRERERERERDLEQYAPKERKRERERPAAAAARADAPMTVAAVEQLIEARVSEGLANHETLRNSTNGHGDGSHNSDTGIRGTVRTPREYTYKDFLNCQPLTFKGTEGVVVLSQWFEKMESMFHISNCARENQVKFATCTFLGNALTWWNSHMKAITQDVAYAMDWKTL